MSYSKRYRECTIEYRQAGHSLDATHQVFKVSKPTIQKWEKQLKETGNLEKKYLHRSFRKIDSEKLKAYVAAHPVRMSFVPFFNCGNYIMNWSYALNRDKLRCRVCGGWLIAASPWMHRINPYLPLNRVNNLVSLHKKCFEAVNNPSLDIREFEAKAQKKIIGYRAWYETGENPS